MTTEKIKAQTVLIDLNLESSKTHTPEILQRVSANEFRKKRLGSRRDLFDGSRISGFLQAIQPSPVWCLLHHQSEKGFDYKRLLSMPADKTRGVKSDQAVTLKAFYPKQKYPERLRRIHYFNPTTKNG
jgi:hypothetical protein